MVAEFGVDGPPSSAGAALGRAIQRIRKAQGIRSQGDFARETGEGESVIAKAESGTRVPTPEVFEAIMDVLNVDAQHRKTLTDLWWLARNQEDPAAARLIPWYEIQARAHTLRYWAPLLIPGPAQTADYARELFNAWGYDKETVEDQVARRTEHQKILRRPDPPDITILVWERVLTTLIGTPEIMRGQIARLLELSEQQSIHVQVLPADGANMGLGGAIHLATTETEEVLVLEGFTEDLVVAEPARVRKASTTFNSVRSDALRRAESRKVLSEAMERWNS